MASHLSEYVRPFPRATSTLSFSHRPVFINDYRQIKHVNLFESIGLFCLEKVYIPNPRQLYHTSVEVGMLVMSWFSFI